VSGARGSRTEEPVLIHDLEDRACAACGAWIEHELWIGIFTRYIHARPIQHASPCGRICIGEILVSFPWRRWYGPCLYGPACASCAGMDPRAVARWEDDGGRIDGPPIGHHGSGEPGGSGGST